MITAIIFDMNGVIVNDEFLHYLAFRKVCKKYGINLTRKSYQYLCQGRTDMAGCRNIIEKYKIKNLQFNHLVNLKNKQYILNIRGRIKAFPGVINLIKKLKQSYTLALTSSARRREVIMVLKHFKLGRYFKATISAEDISCGKPHPEPYLLTAKKLKVKPQNCLVVEDTPAGIQSAKKAGMLCIGITTTHKKHELKNADLVIKTFSEINRQALKKIC